MKELAQVKGAVLSALTHAGLTALEAFPEGRAKAYDGAVVTVSVGGAEGRQMGLSNYLGEWYDESAGTVRELYGKQLEGEIVVEVHAERAADCEHGCEQAAEVLLGGLPVGIRAGELCWEALQWEKSAGLFVRRGALHCQVVFVAESSEDGESFSDFILKGVMQA